MRTTTNASTKPKHADEALHVHLHASLEHAGPRSSATSMNWHEGPDCLGVHLLDVLQRVLGPAFPLRAVDQSGGHAPGRKLPRRLLAAV
eukprot:2870291-Pyramimonas_sp.AAC.1